LSKSITDPFYLSEPKHKVRCQIHIITDFYCCVKCVLRNAGKSESISLMEFSDALTQGNLEAIRRCPKADLHNHFVLGGNRRFLLEREGIGRYSEERIDNKLNL
jgi:hypothetical protein